MNWIKEKRNVLVILVVSGIGSINYLPGKEFRFIYKFLDEKYYNFIVFTSLLYFFTSLTFLFFFKNSAVKSWLLFSLPFICLTIPLYKYINNLRPDIFNWIAFIPIFIIYLVLFLLTPFYLKRKSK